MVNFKNMKYILVVLLFIPQLMLGQQKKSIQQLQERIKHIIDTTGGNIGVGVQGMDFKSGFIINGNHEYPMMSVFKFPLAFAILDKVDKAN
ncbi:hypothetical protein L950_0226485 [Sphingobacterium sp. IITKGP-BTPF85]|nr:hypothetical protein L950_0226485 [Sphingobacterium sp. IITKGP-BTPF85]